MKHMSWLEFEDRHGETREEHAEREQCPICGSYDTEIESYIDGTDRDGNRGIRRTELICHECNGEEEEDEDDDCEGD
jgi:formate dehydrogenase maturation protein FdhE